jgi:hypothetical protein
MKKLNPTFRVLISGKKLNNKIKKLKNGDFEVISTSYDIPVIYNEFELLSNARIGEHSICRDNRSKRPRTLVSRKGN